MPRDVTCDLWEGLNGSLVIFTTVYVGLLVKYVLLQCNKYE